MKMRRRNYVTNKIYGLPRLFNNFAQLTVAQTRSVCLVCIEVHVAFVSITRSYDNLVESQSSRAVELYAYDIAVLHARFFRLSCGQMDMSLRYDHAFFDFNFSGRTYKLTSRSAFQFSGLSENDIDTDSKTVRTSQLYLSLLSVRSENSDTFQRSARAYDIYFFFRWRTDPAEKDP